MEIKPTVLNGHPSALCSSFSNFLMFQSEFKPDHLEWGAEILNPFLRNYAAQSVMKILFKCKICKKDCMKFDWSNRQRLLVRADALLLWMFHKSSNFYSGKHAITLLVCQSLSRFLPSQLLPTDHSSRAILSVCRERVLWKRGFSALQVG